MVKIYVEGGGDSKLLHIQCREGFRKLIEKAGFQGRMPGIVACGGREAAYDAFTTALIVHTDYPLLLVDSEDPVESADTIPDSPTAWTHLNARDGWERPAGANNDQAQMMVTCMETWLMADRHALRTTFGAHIQTSAMLPENDLESRSRHEIQDALERATKNCGKDKAYRKGRRSFQVLAALNPETLKVHLPHFERFLKTLALYL